MTLTIENARNPVRTGASSIDLIVKFAEFQNELPFTATSTDSTDYGPLLYQNALDGLYGTITDN